VDPQGEVHGDDRVFEVAVHDEVGVRQPHVIVVVDRVQELVATRVRVPQSRIEPLLLQQKLHLVFLQHTARKHTKPNQS